MDRAALRTLAIAAAIGVPVAAAVVAFEVVLHGATSLMWDEIPGWFGRESPAAWYVIAVPALAGLLVALCMRLPGGAGHSPLEGLGLRPPRPTEMPSILAAAVVSLAAGVVLGPEAPLMAIGLVLGAVAARSLRAAEDHVLPIAVAGAFAAIAGLFGGPFVASLMLFEVAAASGAVAARQLGQLLLPGFVAAGTGALVYTGVGDWPGVEEAQIALPGLPAYDTVRLVDLAWCVVIAAGVAALVVGVRRGGVLLDRLARVNPLPALVGAGAVIGVVAVVFRALADRPVDLVLFSGQTSEQALISETSASVLLAVVACKALAYGLSMGAGFRGGPIFPAITIGVALGGFAAQVLPGLDLTPAVIAGVAAGAAAAMKLPFTGGLLASVLAGSAAADVAPIAVFASVVAWLVTMAVGRPAAEEKVGPSEG